MYTIYKHTNVHTNKSYIGQTKFSMEKRWKHHRQGSVNKAKNNHAFANALLKYPNEEDWLHTVITTTESKEEANKLEIEWIQKEDTFKNGYNSTLGGDYFNGFIPKKGEESPHSNISIVELFHKDGRHITGTSFYIAEQCNLKHSSVRSLLLGKQKSLFGWALTKDIASSCNPKTEKVSPVQVFIDNIINVRTYTGKIYATPIDKLLLKSKQKDLFLSDKNPTKGKSRPDYVKRAVSERRRKEASTIQYRWKHVSGLVEILSCIELRDKYKEQELNISKLNAISKKLKNKKGYLIGVSHKGWFIET